MAIQKQINYQVNFQANTANVQSALANLQSSLRTIQATPIAFDSTGLVAAKQNAQELQVILQKATNVNTGKLDIGKFSQQLKTSGKDLATYANSLKQLGPQGQQAFMQLAQSIGQAHVPLRTTNKLLNSLWINLKNVAKWQVSSNLLMGFTSGISNAVQYTKDLNKNLNDIRIVSGQSADQMERFAEKANKAAKALSSSTNEYTKAALIYYQQGLNDQQVKERTDATIKMANVTGEAADDVSSYMTAIWNNFDNGSKSLEYYADVMTALGAATASSTDEIATGLEKFAGIAETVGLSYEYATSALATLVAETRQSPETVGTALKTIFSRLQGLKLGKTLDDGTTLNKYSEALKVVGVDIKNSNGSLKDMDLILEELASKWNLIGKDQQMALAQTVGGVRQYTQLITLMDNWGDMQNNLNTAFNSEGELNKQAEIYAESWEAASERTRASLEKLYSDLVPEEFLIDFTNTMGGFVDAVDGVVEGIGGLGPILIMTLSMVASKLMPQILQGGQNIVSNMAIALGFGEKQTQNFIHQAQKELNNLGITKQNNALYEKILDNTQKILEKRDYELKMSKFITQARKDEIELQIESLNKENEMIIALGEKKKALANIYKTNTSEGTNYATKHSTGDRKDVIAVQSNLTANAKFDEYTRMLGVNAEDGAIGQLNGKNLNDAKSFIAQRSNSLNKAFQDSYNISVDEQLSKKGVFEYIQAYDAKNQAGNEVALARQNAEKLGVRINGAGRITDTSNSFISEKGLSPEQKQVLEEYRKAIENNKTALTNLEQVEKKYKTTLTNSEKQMSRNASAIKKIEGLKTREFETVQEAENEWNEYTSEIVENTTALLENSQQKATSIVGDKNADKMEKTARGLANVNFGDIQGQTPEEIEAENKQLFNEAKAKRNDSYAQSIQGVTSAMSGAYMAMQSIQSLGNIWSNDDLTMGEKIMSSFMSISMAAGGLTSTIGGASKAIKGFSEARKQAAMMEAAAAKLTKKANDQENQSHKKNILHRLGKALAGTADDAAMGNPVPLATVIGVAAGIAALVGGISLAVGASIRKNHKETAEKDYNDFSEKNTFQQENQKSVIKYQNLLQAYEETGEGKDKLAEQAEKLGKAYGVEGAALASLTGDYEQFTKDLNEEIKKQNNILSGSALTSAKSLANVIYDENGLEKGWGGNGWGTSTFTGSLKSTLSQTKNIINSENGYKYITMDGSNVNFEAKTNEETVYMIAEMRRLKEELEAEYDAVYLKGDTLYQGIIKKLATIGEDSVNKSTEIVTAMMNADLSTDILGKSANDITEYYKLRNELIKDNTEYTEEQIDTFLESSEQFKEFFKETTAIEEFAKQIGLTEGQISYTNEVFKELIDLYEKYGNIIFTPGIVQLIDGQLDYSKDNLEFLKQQTDFGLIFSNIEVKLKISEEWEKAVKEGYDKVNAFFEKHSIPFYLRAEIMKMEPEKQKEILNNLIQFPTTSELITKRLERQNSVQNWQGGVIYSSELEQAELNLQKQQKEYDIAQTVLDDEELQFSTQKTALTNFFDELSKVDNVTSEVFENAAIRYLGITSEQLKTQDLGLLLNEKYQLLPSQLGFDGTIYKNWSDLVSTSKFGYQKEGERKNTVQGLGNKGLRGISDLQFTPSKNSLNSFNQARSNLSAAQNSVVSISQSLGGYTKKEWEQLLFLTNTITDINTLNKLWDEKSRGQGNYFTRLKQITKENSKMYAETVKYEKEYSKIINDIKLDETERLEEIKAKTKEFENQLKILEKQDKIAQSQNNIQSAFNTLDSKTASSYEKDVAKENIVYELGNIFDVQGFFDINYVEEHLPLIQQALMGNLEAVKQLNQEKITFLFEGENPKILDQFKELATTAGVDIGKVENLSDQVQNLFNNSGDFNSEGFKTLMESVKDTTTQTVILKSLVENFDDYLPKDLVMSIDVLFDTQNLEAKDLTQEDINKINTSLLSIDDKYLTTEQKNNRDFLTKYYSDLASFYDVEGNTFLEGAANTYISIASKIIQEAGTKEAAEKISSFTTQIRDALDETKNKIKENWDASSENNLERDSEYLAKWRGMLEDNKQNVEDYQSIIDSSITSDQEKLKAVEDLNKAYKDQSDYLNNLAWGYGELAKKSRDDIFTGEGKLKAETIIGYDKNNNPIKLGSALKSNDFETLMAGIDWANISEGDKNTLELRTKQLLDANDKATKAALVGVTDEAAIEDIQKKGKNRTTGLNYFLKAFTDYYEFNKEADNFLREQKQISDKQNENNLKGNEIRYAQAARSLEIEKAKIEKSLALTENSNDLNVLAARIERQGDLARIAFKEYEIAKHKYENLLDTEQASDEQIHDAYLEMLNAETEALNSQKTAYEELTNVVDKYYEQMEHLTKGSDTIISVTESMKEILGNLNKESQKAIADTNRTLVTLKNKNLEILKQERDTNQAIVKELKNKLAEAEATGNQVGIDMYRKQLDEATSKWRESEEELMSELASTLDEIGEIYEETIDGILKEWSEVAAGLQANLESLSDEFKKQKDLQEQYLDDETQIYELDKMRRTINKELANNKNLIAHQKLSDVLEKINEIQEKGIKMSEYDLKMLQARYDLRKAEIALEEAQNNKSEVRLMRNAQGNWSYVFTANQSAIADAEQKVADEQEKIRNESEDYSMQVQEKLIDMEKERQEALAEAYKEYKDDEKALQKETDRINAYYNSKFQYFGSELGKTLDVLGIDFSDTSYSILTGYKSWDEAQTQFAENGVKYLDQMSGALGQFKADSKDAMEAAGQDIDTFATNVKDVYAPQVEEAMTTVVDSVGNKCKEMLGQIEQMIQDMIALMNSVEWKTPKGSGSSYKTFIDKDGDVYTGIDDNKDGNADWFFSAAARGYDTGGYTGDWNSSDGKIAILHEKELVLNKADTKNILSAVDIMRSIVGSSYGQIRGLANAFSVNNIATPATQLEQQVHIDATFPGVTNALEIETALNNIVNDVAQYTQKK